MPRRDELFDPVRTFHCESQLIVAEDDHVRARECSARIGRLADLIHAPSPQTQHLTQARESSRIRTRETELAPDSCSPNFPCRSWTRLSLALPDNQKRQREKQFDSKNGNGEHKHVFLTVDTL